MSRYDLIEQDVISCKNNITRLQLCARYKSCKNFQPRYALLTQDIISCMNNFARSKLPARYKSFNIFNGMLQEIMTR
jgi:hypothetical protein